MFDMRGWSIRGPIISGLPIRTRNFMWAIPFIGPVILSRQDPNHDIRGSPLLKTNFLVLIEKLEKVD